MFLDAAAPLPAFAPVLGERARRTSIGARFPAIPLTPAEHKLAADSIERLVGALPANGVVETIDPPRECGLAPAATRRSPRRRVVSSSHSRVSAQNVPSRIRYVGS